MNDEPFPVNLAHTAGSTEPHVRLLTILQPPRKAFQSMDKPDIATAQDPHVAEFHVNWTIVLGEELYVVLTICLFALVLEWRRHVVGDYGITRGIKCHDSFNIVGLKDLRPSIV